MNPLAAPVLGEVALDAMSRVATRTPHVAGKPYYADPDWLADETALRRDAEMGDPALYHQTPEALAEVVALDTEVHRAGRTGDLALLEAS
ncbi:hypothetical protein [Parafrankia sp. FMc2]|uniref:hypothetical protein n=1 Tax=Parafrankia sp. FMc2 TaxID=3233196 RepID=UPI0034D586B0